MKKQYTDSDIATEITPHTQQTEQWEYYNEIVRVPILKRKQRYVPVLDRGSTIYRTEYYDDAEYEEKNVMKQKLVPTTYTYYTSEQKNIISRPLSDEEYTVSVPVPYTNREVVSITREDIRYLLAYNIKFTIINTLLIMKIIMLPLILSHIIYLGSSLSIMYSPDPNIVSLLVYVSINLYLNVVFMLVLVVCNIISLLVCKVYKKCIVVTPYAPYKLLH